jgi:two-component system, OmpR family, sensor histidine kinase VicK
LEEAATIGVKVRILVPSAVVDKRQTNKVFQEIRMQYNSLDILDIKNPLKNRQTTFIVDQSLVLIVELIDDSKEIFQDSIGLATYSNSESSVMTYASIFENIWVKSEAA